LEEIMKSTTSRCLVFPLLLVICLVGCFSPAGGPQTWIDFPLNDSSIPLAPVSITAHASHSSGVGTIVFAINGDDQAAVTVGGTRLEDATYEWVPPATGRYSLEVRSQDRNGNFGSSAVVFVTVGDPVSGPTTEKTTPGTPTSSLTPTEGTPTLSATPTITRTASLTPTITNTRITPSATPRTPEPPPEPMATANQNANCREGPSTEYEVSGYLMLGEQALIEGQLAGGYWYVITPPGSTQSCWIAGSVVNVTGDLGTVNVVSPPPPPEDTIPPEILASYANPSLIYQDYPCSGYPVTGQSIVQAADDSGISSVKATWTIRNQSGNQVASGNLGYSSNDGTTFKAQFGPSSYTGSITINGVVTDNAGNQSTFSQMVQIDYCP
jgi:hypothetical protein